MQTRAAITTQTPTAPNTMTTANTAPVLEGRNKANITTNSNNISSRGPETRTTPRIAPQTGLTASLTRRATWACLTRLSSLITATKTQIKAVGMMICGNARFDNTAVSGGHAHGLFGRKVCVSTWKVFF